MSETNWIWLEEGKLARSSKRNQKFGITNVPENKISAEQVLQSKVANYLNCIKAISDLIS